jgi:hypothetical protein
LRDFYSLIAATNDRSSFKIFEKLKYEFPEVWKGLHLDILIDKLHAQRGNRSGLDSILKEINDAAPLAKLKAMLINEFKK